MLKRSVRMQIWLYDDLVLRSKEIDVQYSELLRTAYCISRIESALRMEHLKPTTRIKKVLEKYHQWQDHRVPRDEIKKNIKDVYFLAQQITEREHYQK